MESRLIQTTIVFIAIAFLITSCVKAEKGSFSGQVLRDGEPARGSVRVIDPNNMAPLAESTVSKDGKFFIKDAPTGEWLIALTTRTGGVIGHYHYVKITGMASTRVLIFDASENDPKAEELLAKFSPDETDPDTQSDE